MLFALCEDDDRDREALLALLRDYARESGISLREPLLFAHARELLAWPEVREADAIFLDIFLDGEPLGVEAARTLRREGFAGALVFITSSDGFYPEGFEVEAAHYLVKPVRPEDFRVALERIVRNRRPPARTLDITINRAPKRIPYSDLLYAEVYDHKTLLHTTGGTLTTALTLTELEALLGGDPFLRCFRSYIVNMERVAQAADDHFLLRDGTRIPITRRDAAAIKEKYLAFCLARMKGRGV